MYNFGPAHTERQFLFDILQQPVPEEVDIKMKVRLRHHGKTNKLRSHLQKIFQPCPIGFHVGFDKEHIPPFAKGIASTNCFTTVPLDHIALILSTRAQKWQE